MKRRGFLGALASLAGAGVLVKSAGAPSTCADGPLCEFCAPLPDGAMLLKKSLIGSERVVQGINDENTLLGLIHGLKRTQGERLWAGR